MVSLDVFDPRFTKHSPYAMWPNYNTTDAIARLNSFIARTSQEGGSEVSMSNLDLGNYAVAQVQSSRAYKIVPLDNHDEELVVKVVGIVCSKTLPPFRGTLQTATEHHRRKLRQHVKLTGAGSLLFDNYETKFHSIVDFFGGSVGTNRIDVGEQGLFDQHYAIDFHTRYFEERRHAPDVHHIPFDETVDPNGILESSRGVDLVHGEHNVVEYCSKSYGEDGTPQYTPLHPREFAVGDIVEVCSTFTMYPFCSEANPDVRFKVVHGLRTLSLITQDFSKSMRQARVNKPSRPRKIFTSNPKRSYLLRKSSGTTSATGLTDHPMQE